MMACHSSASKGPCPVEAIPRNSASTSAQRSGISASTAMRARVSSPRLVSCVDRVVMAVGHDACRSACAVWKPATPSENSPGSPPTSVSEPSRV